MRYRFRWNDSNRAAVAKHGLSAGDVEWVVEHARRPYPFERRDAFLVCGPTRRGSWIEVMFTVDPPPADEEFGTDDMDAPIGDDELAELMALADRVGGSDLQIYVFHAMPMPPNRTRVAQAKIRRANS